MEPLLDSSTKKTTSLVKYFEILPHEPIIHPNQLPTVALDKIAVVRARNPTISFYRYLYNTVGGPWFWIDRRRMDDEKLLAAIRHDDITIDVLYIDGVPAGYYELDWKVKDDNTRDVEVLYFGLIPDFIGLRLGPWLLDHALCHIRDRYPDARIWVHTCSFDHPKAVLTYQNAGFKYYKEEEEIVDLDLGNTQ